MVATTIDSKHWKFIMAPLLKSALPKGGIAQTFPRDVLYGPLSFQGLDLKDPWYHQEILHLITSVEETLHSSITGQLITAIVEQLRLEAGIPGFLTDHAFEPLSKLLTDTWVTTMWKFADQFQIEL